MLLNALLFDVYDTPLPRRTAQMVTVLHLLGVLAIARLSHEWLWLGLPLIWFVIPAYISMRQAAIRLYIETLTPMFVAYGVISVRILLVTMSRLYIVASSATDFDRYGVVLDITTATIVSLLWIVAIQIVALARYYHVEITWQRGLHWLAYVLLVVTAIWSIWAYLATRAHGVTASDPYAYVQMGYDLATTGSLEHTFDLTSLAVENNLSRKPLAPIGYTIPDAETGQASTVWSPGYAAFLAVAYLVAGEVGFYLLTPLAGLLTLLTTTLLSFEILHSRPDYERWLTAAIVAFVLATSLLQVLWLAVPMADIPSQLFTTLSIYFALATVKSDGWKMPLLAGICLGTAFGLRYTQVMIGVGIVAGWTYIYLHKRSDFRQWVSIMLSAGIGAWLMAIPVLYYHTVAFGGPFDVGSEELEIFGMQYILDSGWHMIVDAFTVEEFRLLLPFILWGGIRLWQVNRTAGIMLNLSLLVILVFHLPYAALRLRDLLSIFPILAIYTGFGIVDLLNRLSDLCFPRIARAVYIGLIIVLLWIRSEESLGLIDGVFNNFGYLNDEQRQSFDVVSGLTAEDAIIAASLNSGPLILYSERDIVRPYDWHPDEWFAFIGYTTDRDLYLLVDGVEMQQIFDITGERYTLEPVTRLPMPYFYVGGGSENQRVALIRLNRD